MFGQDPAVVGEQPIIEGLEHLVAAIFVAVAHGGPGRALRQPEVRYEGLADTDPRRYIAKGQALVQLSENQGGKLVVGPVLAAPFVGFMRVGAACEHPARYMVNDLVDERLVRIFGSPEESH